MKFRDSSGAHCLFLQKQNLLTYRLTKRDIEAPNPEIEKKKMLGLSRVKLFYFNLFSVNLIGAYEYMCKQEWNSLIGRDDVL